VVWGGVGGWGVDPTRGQELKNDSKETEIEKIIVKCVCAKMSGSNGGVVCCAWSKDWPGFKLRRSRNTPVYLRHPSDHRIRKEAQQKD